MKIYSEIRRVDDLGRIVLPKEVRRLMKIHEGDPLDVFVIEEDDGQKYIRLDYHSEIKNGLGNNAQAVAGAIAAEFPNYGIAITDHNFSVIATRRKLVEPEHNDKIKMFLLQARMDREISEMVIDRDLVVTAIPLIKDGEVIAFVIIRSDKLLDGDKIETLKTMASVICAMM